MDISICPMLFDVDAPLLIDNLHKTSDIDTLRRRVSRTATLDLSASFYDSGYSVADRTLTVSIKVTNREDWLVYLAKKFVKYYSELSISIKEGLFLGVIQSVFLRNDVLTLSVLLKSERN